MKTYSIMVQRVLLDFDLKKLFSKRLLISPLYLDFYILLSSNSKDHQVQRIMFLLLRRLFIWRWASLFRRAGSARWDDFYPTFIWNLLSQFNENVCYVAGKRSWRTNVLILFSQHPKNKTKLIKENSISPCQAGLLARLHMENLHLT